MKTSHPEAFKRYGAELINIIAYPDYIGHRDDGTFEYIKEFTENGEHVKVAVRMSSSTKLFARSLYVLNDEKVNSYITKSTLKRASLTE